MQSQLTRRRSHARDRNLCPTPGGCVRIAMSTLASSTEKVRRPLLSRQLRRDLRAYLFLSPWLIGLLAFTAYPTLASFYFSLTKYNILTPPRWVGADNYVKLFTK